MRSKINVYKPNLMITHCSNVFQFKHKKENTQLDTRNTKPYIGSTIQVIIFPFLTEYTEAN